jgi:CBS domain-containing protein
MDDKLFAASKKIYDITAQQPISSLLSSDGFQKTYSEKFSEWSSNDSKRYPSVTPTASLQGALEQLRKYKVTSLPVIDKEVIGMVYLVDVLIALNNSDKQGDLKIDSIMKSSQQISALSPIPLLLEIFTSTEFKYSVVVDEYLVDQMDLLQFLLNDELFDMDGTSVAGLYKRLPLHSSNPLSVPLDQVEEGRLLQVVLNELCTKSSCVVNGKLYVVSDLLQTPMTPHIVHTGGSRSIRSIFQDCKELGIHFSSIVCSKTDLLALFAWHIY